MKRKKSYPKKVKYYLKIVSVDAVFLLIVFFLLGLTTNILGSSFHDFNKLLPEAVNIAEMVQNNKESFVDSNVNDVRKKMDIVVGKILFFIALMFIFINIIIFIWNCFSWSFILHKKIVNKTKLLTLLGVLWSFVWLIIFSIIIYATRIKASLILIFLFIILYLYLLNIIPFLVVCKKKDKKQNQFLVILKNSLKICIKYKLVFMFVISILVFIILFILSLLLVTILPLIVAMISFLVIFIILLSLSRIILENTLINEHEKI